MDNNNAKEFLDNTSDFNHDLHNLLLATNKNQSHRFSLFFDDSFCFIEKWEWFRFYRNWIAGGRKPRKSDAVYGCLCNGSSGTTHAMILMTVLPFPR